MKRVNTKGTDSFFEKDFASTVSSNETINFDIRKV